MIGKCKKKKKRKTNKQKNYHKSGVFCTRETQSTFRSNNEDHPARGSTGETRRPDSQIAPVNMSRLLFHKIVRMTVHCSGTKPLTDEASTFDLKLRKSFLRFGKIHTSREVIARE